MASSIRIQTEDFDLSAEVARLREDDLRVGAVCAFVGTVRDMHALTRKPEDEVQAMELEHYPGMTEASIAEMVAKAHQRFDFFDAVIVHRVGRLLPADQIVLVAVSSAHRGESYKACEFLMDYLKTQAPFWKKEHTPAGAHWVDARVSDDQALARWGLDMPNA